MGQVSSRLRRATGGYLHWCPGCEEMHILPDGWAFDGNLENPTFAPSFKHSGRRRDASGNTIPFVCHYILTAGVLNFCVDSNHALAGEAIPLPKLPEGFTDDASR